MRNRFLAQLTTLAVLAGLAPIAVQCQEQPNPPSTPSVQLFVGYSYADVALGSQTGVFAPAGSSYNGYQIDATLDLRHRTGLLVDFAQQTGRSTIPDPLGHEAYMTLYDTQLLIGPEFAMRSRKYDAFTHALIGLTRMSLNELKGYYVDDPDFKSLATRTSLTLGGGGGIDRDWGDNLAVRLVQIDYIPNRLDGTWKAGLRLSTGIIFKF